MEKIDCKELPHGITTIDTGYYRPGFDASHLLVEKDQAALVHVKPAAEEGS